MKIKVKPKFISPESFVAFALILSSFYWGYLLWSSQMYIVYDAQSYQDLGTVIYKNGWIEFFKMTPYNVPLYPFVISIAMRFGDLLQIPFLKIQTCFQILILFSTQLLLLKIFSQLKVHHYVRAALVLYLGVSPAIVNSTFSLWSEIMTYPLVLGIVLFMSMIWTSILQNAWKKACLFSLVVSCLMVCASLANAAFEYVLFFLLGFLTVLSFPFLFQNQRVRFMKAVAVILGIFLAFQLAITPYKTLNLKYNGHKVLVIKGAASFYANALRRTQDLEQRQFLTALAFIPGEGVCERLFSREECAFWSIEAQHGFWEDALKEFEQKGVARENVDSLLFSIAIEEIAKKPLQYAFLTFLESVKMFFWESTRVGYVFYPAILEKIFFFEPLNNALRLSTFLLTLTAFLFLKYHLWQSRREIYVPGAEQTHLLLFLFITAVSFIVLFSLSSVATRYAFPIVAIYLSVIGFLFQKMLIKAGPKSS